MSYKIRLVRTNITTVSLVRNAYVVDDNVNTLNIDTTTEDIRSNHNTFREVLEALVPLDTKIRTSMSVPKKFHLSKVVSDLPLLLVHLRVNADGREVTFDQQFVQFVGTLDRLDENADLVELQLVQKVIELAVLFVLGEFDVVLDETVKSELRLIVDVNFEWLVRRKID
jgi:hypothetical protein